MFINNFDPIAFQVFSLEIRWYSLSYFFGLIFGWIYFAVMESSTKQGTLGKMALNIKVVDLDHINVEFLQLKGLLDQAFIKPLYLV